MAGDKEKDRTELRKEIRIAIFWRQLIGDYEYIKFNPDDVLRWHLALEDFGDTEVRALMAERYTMNARRTPVLGLVGYAPHPPAWIVREWLSTQEPKFPKWSVFTLMCTFTVVAGMLLPTIHGCNALKTSNPLAYKPPSNAPSTALPSTDKYTVQVSPGSAPIPMPTYSTMPPTAPGVMAGGQSPPVSEAQMGVRLSAGPFSNTGTTGASSIGLSGGAGATKASGSSSSAPPR